MIKSHIQYVAFLISIDYIKKNSPKLVDKNIKDILILVVKVFAMKALLTETQGLYECGFFGPGSQKIVEDAFHYLLTELRPHMIPIVESFHTEAVDRMSTIGNKYGDIYELQLYTAKNTKLNKNPVPSFYEKYMKPTMTMYPAQLTSHTTDNAST